MASPHRQPADLPNSPTSEVGLRDPDQHPEGAAGDNVETNHWKKMFEMQSKNMLELVRKLKEINPTQLTKMNFPEFNPDSGEIDARAWCRTVDPCLEERPVQGSALIISLSSALKGTASSWFTQVNYSGMNWTQFKEIFLARYDTVETPAAVLIRVNSGKPKDGECLPAYAGRLVTSLTARWQSKSVEQIAVATVLAHCVQNEPRLQRLAYTTDINSRSALQQELMANAYRKRQAAPENTHQKFTPNKKQKITCYTCGKLGYKSADCYHRKTHPKKFGTGQSDLKGSNNQDKGSITCFRCGRPGHISSQCKSDASAGHSNAPTKRQINVCTVQAAKSELTQSGEKYLFCFDSGAECSLIRESIANKFSGRRVQSPVTLLVIGESRVATNLQVVSRVVIDEYIVEIPFHVVPDEYLAHDILIGRDLIAQGFTAEVSRDHFCLKRTAAINVCKVGKRVENFEDINTDLIDPNCTVQRRPYRRSPEERKKDGSNRLCVDYRELNRNTVPNRCPLPLIDDQVQRLSDAVYFTTLDMASGFHQIPIHKDSVQRTAFVTPDGHYEYLSMPFGSRNAPSVFQRAINKSLSELVNTFAVCYMDDIMIPANSVEQSLERLEIVLDKLSSTGFSLNKKKCSFLKTSVDYLGYQITANEIRPNPQKVRALTESSPPSTVTQVRQLVGLASYFRQFIPKFSQFASPLYKLTAGKGKIEWKTQHEEIRQKLIKSSTSEPVLTIFNPSYPIELHTDASADGYGAVLMQRVNGKSLVVAYYSKKTTDAESRYHSYELETLKFHGC
ncbi:uncharacterized protein LOC124405577 [Diprion similis]|uniref:uncharacterized protein LOC124405577 n=1 Tax=Diprion similis TaxID=362088 RepID=UPI001EF976B8|nr:uncharacterized protein LOC124405577 [Diprion similis]